MNLSLSFLQFMEICEISGNFMACLFVIVSWARMDVICVKLIVIDHDLETT